MNAPRTTETQVSYTRRANSWIVTASGGVELALEPIVSRTQTSDQVERVREQSKPLADAESWWWD